MDRGDAGVGAGPGDGPRRIAADPLEGLTMLIAPLVWIVVAQVPMTPMTGTVVGPGGEPVVGANLILVGLPSDDPPILARGESGAGGRFSIDRPTALAGDHHPQRAAILWAVKPGFRVSATRFAEALPRPNEPVRIVLVPPGKAEVRVIGPTGLPLVGVKVRPERLKPHQTHLPDVVAELTSATTGPDGLAVIDAVAPDELAYVDVHSREFGIQGRPIAPEPGKPAEIAMRKVSTWKGRLAADVPEHARGWRVRASTRIWELPTDEPPTTDPPTTGFVETATDAEGRFTLAPIAVGLLQLNLHPPGDLAVAADPPTTLVVQEGREDSTDIPLKRTVTVTGLIVERGTGKPVPGVSASLIYLGSTRNGGPTVRTDERGRFTIGSFPGRVRVMLHSFPATHVQAPGQGWDDFPVPEPPKVIELTTIDALPAAPPLLGRVVDESGRAVPGATVQATWELGGGGRTIGGSVRALADDEGNFVLGGLGPGSTVAITAKVRDRQSKKSLLARAGDVGPVTVAIAPTPMLAVAGRLLGPGGTPLGGIPVRVEFRVPRDNFQGLPERAWFELTPVIKTAPDGTFKTPKELERKPSDFRIEVAAEGFRPARTDWVPVTDGDLLTLPDLTLKPMKGVRVVSGRVVDRAGKPLAGALVSQAGDGPKWTFAEADADGQFRLQGVAGGRALIFAEAAGFRFGGAFVVGGADPLEIRLARQGEPPIATLKASPAALSRAEERALARELLEPLLPLARSGSLGAYGELVIPTLARLNPARVLDMIEDRTVFEPSPALIQAALGQFEDDPASAIATIEADLDPGTRAVGWLALEGFRPAPDRARRMDLLDRALADARRATSDGLKIKLFGQVADRWLELGLIERARPILLEGRGVVAAWPEAIWFSQAEDFAEVLAVIDLPAAIAFFERRARTSVSPTDAWTLNRHKGQAAIRLAGLDPAAAERLIAPPSAEFGEREVVVLKVAHKMARADLARARRVLETIDDKSVPGRADNPALVSFGLGAIAGELAGTDPIRARGLLDEAFAGLRKIAFDGRPGQGPDFVAHGLVANSGAWQGQGSVANLMAELLPIVGRLDPDRLAERTWLVAGSRAPSAPEPRGQEFEGIFALAMLVARHDRAIADAIAAEGLERLPDRLAGSVGSYGNALGAISKNLTTYDPRALVALIQVLPDAARKPPPKPNFSTAASIESQIRLAAAQILGFPAEARPRQAGRIGYPNSPFHLGN